MAKHVFQRSGTPYNILRRSQRFNPIIVEPIPLKSNRNFALKKQAHTESVRLEAPAWSGSLYPADNNTSNENVNGKQRTAAAAALVEESVKKIKKTRNRRNCANFACKDNNKKRKPTNPTYFINTRGTLRSEIVISTSDSISSYYTSLLNEDLVIPTKPIKKLREKPSQTTTNLLRNKSSSTNKGRLRTERLKVVKRQLKRKQAVFNSIRKRVLFEAVSAYGSKTVEENSTSDEVAEEDSESEPEQVGSFVSRKSFFERSIEGFCKSHPAFNNATQRCLNRLQLVRSTISMNSPVSPSTPAIQQGAAMLTVSTSTCQHATTTASHSGKRKHSDDTAPYSNDHNYNINNNNNNQSTTPPGNLSSKHHHLAPSQQQQHSNQLRLSPRFWIYQTPDKQKQCKLPPPSTVCDRDDPSLVVPVMLHHNKRLKTVYSFDESAVVDLVQVTGGGDGGASGSGGLMEVQIDSDRLAPICQITTADDGADCEFETSSNGAISPSNVSSSTSSSVVSVAKSLAAEELNQFQLQAHELSLDFNMATGTADKRYRRLSGENGENDGTFLDQWVRMNGGRSGDHSPLRVLQQHQHLPTTSATNVKPLGTINQHLRTIHNVATQRPTKALPRCDRRQYLERKSLTFEENCSTTSSPCDGETPTGGRLRVLKQKAASVDSICGGEMISAGGLGSARKRSMDLFSAGRSETLRDISETITSGTYERECAELSHEQENIMPPSRMRLLLGNLQMNDSVDINYDCPLYPRRDY